MGERQGQRVRSFGKVLTGSYPEVTGPLCAQVDGFSLHAGVYCRPWERDKLEKLCRYVARPAVAEERLTVLGNGTIVYKLKKPYWDGTSHLLFSPEEFMEKLAALVPLPRAHLTRFHGILAPHAKLRKDVVPKSKTIPSGKDTVDREAKPTQNRVYLVAYHPSNGPYSCALIPAFNV